MFVWESHHGSMEAFMRYGLESTFSYRLCHAFKLLILYVLTIF